MNILMEIAEEALEQPIKPGGQVLSPSCFSHEEPKKKQLQKKNFVMKYQINFLECKYFIPVAS